MKTTMLKRMKGRYVGENNPLLFDVYFVFQSNVCFDFVLKVLYYAK